MPIATGIIAVAFGMWPLSCGQADITSPVSMPVTSIPSGTALPGFTSRMSGASPDEAR